MVVHAQKTWRAASRIFTSSRPKGVADQARETRVVQSSAKGHEVLRCRRYS